MKISEYLSKDEVEFYTRKSDLKGLKVLFTNWLAIFIICALVYNYPNPFTIIIGMVLLAGRQLGLAVLMHECGHRTLFKTPELNDSLGQWLCALPVVSSLPLYAAGHLKHHKLAGTFDDPDLSNYKNYPIDKKSFQRKLLRDLRGETGFKLIKGVAFGVKSAFSSEAPKADNPFLQLLFVQFALFAIFSLLFAPWIYLLWVASFLTFFMLIIRLRQIAEHANVPDLYDLDPRNNTRTTIPRYWERMVFAPNWVNYHLEHHFMAGVPCYRLKALHQLLKRRGAYDETKLFHGYASVLRHAVNA